MKQQPINVEVRGEFTDDHAKAALVVLHKIWDRVAREQGKRLVVSVNSHRDLNVAVAVK